MKGIGVALPGAAMATGAADTELPAADKPAMAANTPTAPTDAINAGFLTFTLLSSYCSSTDEDAACAARLKPALNAREGHHDPQPMRVGVRQGDLRAMTLGDGFDNGQAQATAAFAGIRRPIEARKGARAVGG